VNIILFIYILHKLSGSKLRDILGGKLDDSIGF